MKEEAELAGQIIGIAICAFGFTGVVMLASSLRGKPMDGRQKVAVLVVSAGLVLLAMAVTRKSRSEQASVPRQSNQLVSYWRKKDPAATAGKTDDELTVEYGLKYNIDSLSRQYPDWRADWNRIVSEDAGRKK